jgi:hypothetical protein
MVFPFVQIVENSRFEAVLCSFLSGVLFFPLAVTVSVITDFCHRH